MRHRAAMGLSEETDAVAIAVSEETGTISVAQRGHIVQGLDAEGLRSYLAMTLTPTQRPGNWLVDQVRRGLAKVFARSAATAAAPVAGFSESTTADPEPFPPAEPRAADENISREAQP